MGTERVETGRARLRKHVVTDTERVEVPVEREEVVLEREPADGRAGGTLSEEEVDVTLTEERPVVEKETVATENVRLGKRSVTDDETVQTDVSREELEVDGDGLDDSRGQRGRGEGTGAPGRGIWSPRSSSVGGRATPTGDAPAGAGGLRPQDLRPSAPGGKDIALRCRSAHPTPLPAGPEELS